MEINRFKSAWQQQPVDPALDAAAGRISRSVPYLRVRAIGDLQRSDEVARVVFCILFALLVGLTAFLLMPDGKGRLVSLLLAFALLVDGGPGAVLLAARLRASPAASVLEHLQRESRQLRTCLGVERYSRWIQAGLFAISLVLFISGRSPAGIVEGAYETLGTMACLTAFLAFAWWRARSRSREFSRELDRYLRDLAG